MDANSEDGRDPDERSGVKSASALGLEDAPNAMHRASLADACESERTRLIADLAKLVREPSVPESMRLAGLTLIGWLARRRSDESPHAIGIEEARESERRMRAVRNKTR
ncbi:MAG: hypothetical protein ABSC94_09485 [Polyangiaceae bacterium]